jgi:threonine synthase
MKYKSTRSKDNFIYSSEAIIRGISEDGGLYVPGSIPKLEESLENLTSLNYKALAYLIMSKFFTDFDELELKECIEKAYDSKFDTPLIAPLKERVGVHFMELYHGPTLAFKDMALSILPHLLKVSVKKQKVKRKIVILTATSGDTGKAALQGFADVEGTKIMVFFPEDGVSEIQRLQMITQEGSNVFVSGIKGNFDDAQNGVKRIFNDREFGKELNDKGYMLSSANSINIGRLIPQVVYYFYGYLSLLKDKKIQAGEGINVVVPTGNFGNILAAYYAKSMGLPVKKLICASNENNVLYDFLNTGVYDRRRELKLTSSPSMDILISSNLERLLYELLEKDEELIRNLMESLRVEGKYEVDSSVKEKLKEFYGGYAAEEEVLEAIEKVYKDCGYVMDTHTAVAYAVYEKYKKETKDDAKTIIASTASPFKFAGSVTGALNIDRSGLDDFALIDKLSEVTGLRVPEAVKALKDKKIIYNNIYGKDQIKAAVKSFLKV